MKISILCFKRIKGAVMLTTGLFLLFLAGCGAYIPDGSALVINKNGSVEEYLLEEFPIDLYDIDDWKAEALQEINNYNSQAGEESISLSEINLLDSVLKVKMTYSSYKDYMDFNDITLFADTIREAEKAGYSIPKQLTGIDGNKIITAELDRDKFKVAVVAIPTEVVTYGKVMYMSDGVIRDNNSKVVTVTNDEELSYIIFK